MSQNQTLSKDNRYYTIYNDTVHSISIIEIHEDSVTVFSYQRPNTFDVPIEHLFDNHATALKLLEQINPDLYSQNDSKFTESQLKRFRQAY